MVEIEVPAEAGPELLLSYSGDQVQYIPDEGIVQVEDHHADEFLAAVPGSRRHVARAEPPPTPARSRAKSAQ